MYIYMTPYEISYKCFNINFDTFKMITILLKPRVCQITAIPTLLYGCGNRTKYSTTENEMIQRR